MATTDELKRRIEAAIPGASAEVVDTAGDGNHFAATVTAAAFADRTRIEQHRMVQAVFDGELGGRIHALAIKTRTESGDA